MAPLPPPDIYRSIAEALVSSIETSKETPIALSNLLANNLKTASPNDETTRVARTLRQVLEIGSNTDSVFFSENNQTLHTS